MIKLVESVVNLENWYIWSIKLFFYPEEMLQHIMSFADGNLDCDHPAQAVLDALCGNNAATYGQQLEDFFESYADMRGLKSKMFKPLKACVHGLV